MIFESVNAISNAKNLEDKYQLEINQLQDKVKVLYNEKIDLDQALNKSVKDKDGFRDDLKDIVDIKQKLERQSKFYVEQTKENMNKLNGDLRQLNINLDKAIDERI